MHGLVPWRVILVDQEVFESLKVALPALWQWKPSHLIYAIRFTLLFFLRSHWVQRYLFYILCPLLSYLFEEVTDSELGWLLP